MLSGLLTFCAGTAVGNMLLKERQKGEKDEEEDVCGSRMTFRNVQGTGI